MPGISNPVWAGIHAFNRVKEVYKESGGVFVCDQVNPPELRQVNSPSTRFACSGPGDRGRANPCRTRAQIRGLCLPPACRQAGFTCSTAPLLTCSVCDESHTVWGQYVDELIQQREINGGNTDYYLLSDLLYRGTALMNAAGTAIQEAYDCDAYGNTIAYDAPGTESNWWADDATTTSNPTCQFIFTGRRFDPETSDSSSQMYFYRARYYSPQLGRFISRDPIGYDGEGGSARIGTAGPVVGGGFVLLDTLYLRPNPVDDPQPNGVIPWRHESPGLDVSSGLIVDHHRAVSPTRINPYADGMSLYQYCRSNPVVLTDPNGELAGYIIAAIAAAATICAKPFYDKAMKTYSNRTDKFRHCWVSCEMSRTCGGALTAVAGLGKEAKDSVRRILNQQEGGTGDWGDSLMDIVANVTCVGLESYFGHALSTIGAFIRALIRDSCECCCNKHYK